MGLKMASSLVLCVLAAIAVSDVLAKATSSKTVSKTVTFSSSSSGDPSSHPDIQKMLAEFGLSGLNLPSVKRIAVSKGGHYGSVSSTRGEFSTHRFTDKGGKNRVRIFYKVYKNGQLISTENKTFLLAKGNDADKEVAKCLKRYKRLIQKKDSTKAGKGTGKQTVSFFKFKGVTLPSRRNVVTYNTRLIGGRRVLFLTGKTYEGAKVVYSKSRKVNLTDAMSTADILKLVKHFRTNYRVLAKKSSKKTGPVNKNKGKRISKKQTDNVSQRSTTTTTTTTNTKTKSHAASRLEKNVYFSFATKGGKTELSAKCTVYKDGKIVATIRKSYTFATTAEMTRLMKQFKTEECT